MSKQVEMITSAGTLRIELDEAKAPLSCANFLAYVNSGHFDGTVFHRVIKGFMLQGGGFDADMKQKATLAPVQNEANNGLKNKTTRWPWRARATRIRPLRSSSSTPPTTPSSTSRPRTPKAGAKRCLAVSWPAWKLWMRSRRCAPAARAFTTTCRWKTC